MRITRGRIAALLLGVFLSVPIYGVAFDLPMDGNPSVRDGGLYAVKSGTANTKQSIESTGGALHVLSSGSGATATEVQGTTADGAAATTKPVQVAGKDGSGNIQAVLTADDGSLLGKGANVSSADNASNSGLKFTNAAGTVAITYETRPSWFDGTNWDMARGTSVGGLSVQGNVAHDAPFTANPLPLGAHARTALPTAVSDNDAVDAVADTYGHLFVRNDHLNRIRCTVTISTATTIQAVGGSCAAPGASLSIYITDILFASNAQAIAADTFPTLKYGTGGTCGSGTTVFWGAMQAAAVQATTIQSFLTPIKIPANNEVCWINSTAGSKFLVISGYIAP